MTKKRYEHPILRTVIIVLSVLLAIALILLFYVLFKYHFSLQTVFDIVTGNYIRPESCLPEEIATLAARSREVMARA